VLNIIYKCHYVSDRIFSRFAEIAANKYFESTHVPKHFLKLLFLIEDKRFALHMGIDPIAICRAFLVNLENRGVIEGGSTIVQQIYDIRQEKKGNHRQRIISRKVKQSVWVLINSFRVSKETLLSEYLNTVYWGKSFYGIDEACQGYFSIERQQLSLAQSFFLAERIACPNILIPYRVNVLLARPPIQHIINQDSFFSDELINLYKKRFNTGKEICRFPEKFHKKSDEHMFRF
jgi:penicillin-binding protein 1A